MKTKSNQPGTKKSSDKAQKLKSDYQKGLLAIEQNRSELTARFPNIITMAIGVMADAKNNAVCVDIFICEGDISKIPKRLKVSYGKNKTGYIRTEVIDNKLQGKSHAIQIGSGTAIFNKRTPGLFGTVGCNLKNQNGITKYFITCNHVLNGDNFYDTFQKGDIIQIKKSGIKSDIGKWHFGKMNEQLDLAVCEYLSNPATTISKEAFVYEGLDKDPAMMLSMAVKVNGKNRAIYHGYIVNPVIDFEIKYANKNVILKNVILVSASLAPINYKSLTEGGDSGALVLTESGDSIIGIVVGGDSKFTCIIPFNKIITELHKLSLSL